MVDNVLMEKLQSLDVPALLELRGEIDRLIGDHGPVAAEMLAVVDARLAQMGPDPDPDAIPFEEFERRLRARRTA